ncbi:MAG: succinate dehydrogenase assembly factor 2 [Congregibacter sp.]
MDEEFKRMQWASRRGMLELDLILEPFVRQHFADLDEAGRQRYRKLMECQDQELFGWFLKKERPADAELAQMVGEVLAATRRV